MLILYFDMTSVALIDIVNLCFIGLRTKVKRMVKSEDVTVVLFYSIC